MYVKYDCVSPFLIAECKLTFKRPERTKFRKDNEGHIHEQIFKLLENILIIAPIEGVYFVIFQLNACSV